VAFLGQVQAQEQAMALDPAVLAMVEAWEAEPLGVSGAIHQVQEAPTAAASPGVQLQAEYQAHRQAWTEKERWASLDRVTHQSYQVLAQVLSLAEQLEGLVQTLLPLSGVARPEAAPAALPAAAAPDPVPVPPPPSA
jgi:hypothetical protein